MCRADKTPFPFRDRNAPQLRRRIGSIRFRGHREDLCTFEVGRSIAAGETVTVPIRGKKVHDALPQEVTMQITVGGHRSLDNYISVELVCE